MEHFVIENVGDNVFRDRCLVELPIENDLIERRIKTTKLAPPGSRAPAQPRAGKGILKVAPVKTLEHGFEIVVPPGRPVFHPPRSPLTKQKNTAAGRGSVRKCPVRIEHFSRGAPPVEAPQQDCGRCLDNWPGSAAKRIG